MASNPSEQGDKHNKMIMEQSPRWLAQDPLRMGWYRLYTRFFFLFTVSWAQWHEYREENRQLRTVADKHQVTTVMLNELCPELAVTVGAYEKQVDVVDVDSTLIVFNRQARSVTEDRCNSQDLL
nr:hypothetical protein [uncultured Bacteroides sp.]